nr:MAG TPA: hypothetical protein [Caudoviricetes sp.]
MGREKQSIPIRKNPAGNRRVFSVYGVNRV